MMISMHRYVYKTEKQENHLNLPTTQKPSSQPNFSRIYHPPNAYIINQSLTYQFEVIQNIRNLKQSQQKIYSFSISSQPSMNKYRSTPNLHQWQQSRDHQANRERQLTYEARTYEDKIKKQMKKFLLEGSVKYDCNYKGKYMNLLGKTVRRDHFDSSKLIKRGYQ